MDVAQVCPLEIHTVLNSFIFVVAGSHCYYLSALLATEQLLETAVGEKVPAIHRRNAIEAVGNTLSRLAADAAKIVFHDSSSDVGGSSTAGTEDRGGAANSGEYSTAAAQQAGAEVKAGSSTGFAVAPVTSIVRADGSIVRTKQARSTPELGFDPTMLLLEEAGISASVGHSVGLNIIATEVNNGLEVDEFTKQSDGNTDKQVTVNAFLHAPMSEEAFRQVCVSCAWDV